MKYRCIKEFELPLYDEYENTTSDYRTVHLASVYETQLDYRSESDIRLYLEDGDDDFGYIDITFNMLDEYFERIE